MAEGTTFVRCNLLYNGTDLKGTFERVDYTTDVYEDGVTYEKYCNVYLPYGYNANDKDTKYNVVYFQHGNGGDPEALLNDPTINYLDALFATGEIEPVIIVMATYYMDVTENVAERKKTGQMPAGDGNWEGIPGNYYMEIIQDVMPLVESRYNTYTESFDTEGLIAARDHRCFSGYSRGSVCTWYMFHNAFEYFKWYAPMSANCTAGKTAGSEISNEEVFQYLSEARDEFHDLDFYIYAASGRDTDAPAMRTQMAYLETRTELFSYGDNTSENNLYYTLSTFPHADVYVPFYYYNSLQVIFH